jgi:hypothetical protein
MSYDLAVWKGPAPTDDDDAESTYEALMDEYQSSAGEPTIPEISDFLDALLARWPDITEDGGEDSPWADGPMENNASGPIIYFGMSGSGVADAVPFVIEEAKRRGLVVFDPQGPPFVLS